MGLGKFWHDAPPTLEQHRALNLTRPLTDGQIGAMTANRRKEAAANSALFNDPSPIKVGWTKPPTDHPADEDPTATGTQPTRRRRKKPAA